MVKKLTMLRVLTPFLSRPQEELHLSEISRIVNSPHPTVRQHLNILEKQGVLRKKTKGRLALYSLNFDNPLLEDYLIIAEKEKLIGTAESSPILSELIDFLRKNYPTSEMLIFGSAAITTGKPNDIDIVMTGKEDAEKTKRFSEKYNKPLHIISVKRLTDIKTALKKEILKKHLIVQGSEKVMRWLCWQQ